ncbi:MAG TPA: hypothetical protein VMW95_09445 [Desulfobacterales bacterium]|nr:hypothetical protein [Desulfobacterales bacterium]
MNQSEKEYEIRLKKFNDAALAKRELGELMYQKNMCFLEGIDDNKLPNINTMNQDQLMAYAEKLGARSSETFAESSVRFEKCCDIKKAKLFEEMETRWFELENAPVKTTPHVDTYTDFDSIQETE